MKEHQMDRPRFTLDRAMEIHTAPSPKVTHVVKNPEGDYSVMSHIVCEWCDYCEAEKQGAAIRGFKEDPYETVEAGEREERARLLEEWKRQSMKTYYTEYPTGLFEAVDDSSALNQSLAKVIYRESDTEDGLPFVFIRQENSKKEY